MPIDIDKIREVVDQVKRDAAKDTTLQQRVKENAPRVLAERGLNLHEVIEAHELYKCPSLTMSGVIKK